MSRRSERVAAEIQRALQKVFAKGLSDPRINGLITITSVKADEDLRTANVLLSVMPYEHAELTLHGLRAASKHIRHLIADDLVLPQTPHLRFKLDANAGKQADIFSALAKVRAELDDAEPENAASENAVPDETEQAGTPTDASHESQASAPTTTGGSSQDAQGGNP